MGLIIKDHSQNKQDIREIARKAVAWEHVRSMLDLGCAYGCFEQSLHTRLDLLMGIDVHEENRISFLRNAKRISDRCIFECAQLPSPIAMPPGSFDLIVSIYSFYFFPEAAPELLRLLAPGGVFLSITHSERMLEEAEQFCQFRRLRKLIERFSAENGEAYLRLYFPSVTHIDYLNHLVFTADDAKDLADYISFKREFIAQDVDPECLKEKLLEELHTKKMLRFNKNDRIFIARK